MFLKSSVSCLESFHHYNLKVETVTNLNAGPAFLQSGFYAVGYYSSLHELSLKITLIASRLGPSLKSCWHVVMDQLNKNTVLLLFGSAVKRFFSFSQSFPHLFEDLKKAFWVIL